MSKLEILDLLRELFREVIIAKTDQCLADKGGLLTLRVREVLRKVMPESCKHQIENFVSRPHGMDPYDGMDCPLWEEPC